jgi:hypothetical protein
MHRSELPALMPTSKNDADGARRIVGLGYATVVAVMRQGPTRWSQVGRCLCCFAHDPKAPWEHGDSYVVVSRLPWLSALHVFGTCGSWSRGYSFASVADAPTAGEATLRLPIPLVLQPIPVVQFANERRHGWVECADSPPRQPEDAWDQRRNARIEKRQPGGSLWLRCRSMGHAGGSFAMEQAVDGLRVRYALEGAAGVQALDHLQWAEWDQQGRPLAATRDGQLQRWDLTGPAWTPRPLPPGPCAAEGATVQVWWTTTRLCMPPAVPQVACPAPQ